MTHFGKIKSYDAGSGSGTITPEEGGDALPFSKSGLQQEAQEPTIGQRYGFETSEVDGSNKSAINLQHQQSDEQSQEEQARNQPS